MTKSAEGDDEKVKKEVRSYAQRDLKILYGYSGTLCAFPGCLQRCIKGGVDVVEPVMTGEICHIEGVGEKGPRHNPKLTKKERDSYPNLILLCKKHHSILDELDPKGQSKYSVDTLKQWKRDLESLVTRRLRKNMPSVTSRELIVVTNYILGSPTDPTADFTLLDPQQKLKKNGLTEIVEAQLIIGLGKSKEVEAFISSTCILRAEFADQVRAGFTAKYKELWNEDLRGDAIFFGLRDYACSNSEDEIEEAAALAILTYLFERCEVFEK